MVARQRRTTTRRSEEEDSGRRERRAKAAKRENINRQRRQLYHSDAGYRNRIRERQRQRYWRNRPENDSPPILMQGILRNGQLREVMIEDTGDIVILECFSLREAGEALGKDMQTVRSWVQNELILSPMLKDTGPGYPQFFREELEAVAGVLAEHEKTSKYLSKVHEETIDALHDAMHAAREALVDSLE